MRGFFICPQSGIFKCLNKVVVVAEAEVVGLACHHV